MPIDATIHDYPLMLLPGMLRERPSAPGDNAA
jgi:trehalose-6-phosphate synthase